MSEQGDAQSAFQEASDTAVVTLAELAAALVADLPNHPAGRTARTVVSGAKMRAVVIALREGVEMAEHDAPPAATLHVVAGEVTVSGGGREWRVSQGQLLPVPPERHAVHAHTDAVVLLTVALD